MPITQSRLLSLIIAGEHYRDACATLRASFERYSSAILRRTMDADTAFADLTAEMNAFTHTDSVASYTLAEERTRYNITHRRNAFEKHRQQIRRAEAGIEPLHTRHRLTVAEIAAAADATDEAFAGLDDLGPVSRATPKPTYYSPLPADIKAQIEAEARAELARPHRKPGEAPFGRITTREEP